MPSLTAGVGAGAELEVLLFVPLEPDVVSALPTSSTGSVLTTAPTAGSPFGRVVAEVEVAPFPTLLAAPDCTKHETQDENRQKHLRALQM